MTSKMKTILILLTCLLTTINVFSQTTVTSRNTNRTTIRAFTSIGQSTFRTNISSPSKFPTTEIRVGIGASIKLTSIIDLYSRFTFGVKVKREAFNNNQYVTVGPPFMELDYVASYRNHYFIEIPLLVNANLPGEKIGIQTGLNYRFFVPNNDAVDFLTNRGEMGLITGAYYNITDKLRIGGNYTFGLTKVYGAGGTIDSQDFNMTVKNQFYQLTIEYLIRK
jgi:hypothetical protein